MLKCDKLVKKVAKKIWFMSINKTIVRIKGNCVSDLSTENIE